MCLQFVAFKPLKVEYAINDLAFQAIFADGASNLIKALWVHHAKQGYKQLVQNWCLLTGANHLKKKQKMIEYLPQPFTF